MFRRRRSSVSGRSTLSATVSVPVASWLRVIWTRPSSSGCSRSSTARSPEVRTISAICNVTCRGVWTEAGRTAGSAAGLLPAPRISPGPKSVASGSAPKSPSSDTGATGPLSNTDAEAPTVPCPAGVACGPVVGRAVAWAAAWAISAARPSTRGGGASRVAAPAPDCGCSAPAVSGSTGRGAAPSVRPGAVAASEPAAPAAVCVSDGVGPCMPGRAWTACASPPCIPADPGA